jgi:hypothetical protein
MRISILFFAQLSQNCFGCFNNNVPFVIMNIFPLFFFGCQSKPARAASKKSVSFGCNSGSPPDIAISFIFLAVSSETRFMSFLNISML